MFSCESTSYYRKEDMNMTKKSHDVAVYGGYIDNDTKLMQSSSGGIATALAEQMIDSGGYVAGVAYSDDFHKAEYIITKNKSDLEKLKGSKYIEIDKKDIYRKVRSLLEQGNNVLFFGLPCIVGALYSFLGERPRNLFTCELVCHGPTSAEVHEEYISNLEKKYKSKIINFSVRHKRHEWMPMYLYAKFANGQEFEKPFYSTEYGFAFSVFGRESCYNCQFKGDRRCADIMIGDFWGASEKDEFWNNKGVSVIFAETEKGNDVVKSLHEVKLFPTTFERAVESNQMVLKSKEKSPQREKFAQLFANKGLIYAVAHTKSFKLRIKSFIVKCIPRQMLPFAKKIYHVIRQR